MAAICHNMNNYHDACDTFYEWGIRSPSNWIKEIHNFIGIRTIC